MKDIYILGAGGHAKEIYFLINQIGGYHVRAFVDVNAAAPVKMGNQLIEVIAEKDVMKFSGASLAMGIGNPKVIRKLKDTFESHFDFPNLIHPGVIADFENISWGKGNIVTANCTLTTHIKIGSFNTFNIATNIGHDVEIGDCNLLNPCVSVSGWVKIGDNNLIGVKATILEKRTIGSNSIIGAASLVLRDVPDHVTVMGVPAVIKQPR
jgi:sugar O-acyltransferase (sialic acid O-acetyltransferase NeuD family)